MIGSSQRPLPDNTQHSQQTNIHAPGGIRNHDLSRRAAADLRLRPCGQWDRREYLHILSKKPTFRTVFWVILTKCCIQLPLQTKSRNPENLLVTVFFRTNIYIFICITLISRGHTVCTWCHPYTDLIQVLYLTRAYVYILLERMFISY